MATRTSIQTNAQYEPIVGYSRAVRVGPFIAVTGTIALEALATFAAYAAKEQAVVLPAFIAVERWRALGRPSAGCAHRGNAARRRCLR
mgnify:CR=1 FL=1